MNMLEKFKLDCSGLVCPMPVAKTKQILARMKLGDILEVEGNFLEAGENIERYVNKTKAKVVEFKKEGENFYIKIQK